MGPFDGFTLKALQQKRGFATLFIGHDIEIVRWVSDRIAVMHGGKVVEQGEAGALVAQPVKAMRASWSPRCLALSHSKSKSKSGSTRRFCLLRR